MLKINRLIDELAAQRSIGVDAGSSAIKAVELSQQDGRPVLQRCVFLETKKGNPSLLLKGFLSRAPVGARIAVGLASPELVVRPVSFPLMPKKELQSAILLEAEHAILNGHKPEEMAIDWHLLGPDATAGSRGLLAVVPKTIVAAKLRLLSAAGVHPAIVDVEGLALWNAYWSLLAKPENTTQTVLLANIGAQTTNLVIVKGRDQLVLIRDLQIGLAAIKSGRGADWTEEIRDSLAYARAKDGLRTLDAALITGGGDEASLLPLAKAAIPAPVNFWNPLDQIRQNPGHSQVDHRIGPTLAIAIGLALRGS